MFSWLGVRPVGIDDAVGSDCSLGDNIRLVELASAVSLGDVTIVTTLVMFMILLRLLSRLVGIACACLVGRGGGGGVRAHVAVVE